MPHGTPTKLFSACLPIFTTISRGGRSPAISRNANAEANSIAALLLKPAPAGRFDIAKKSKPAGAFAPNPGIAAKTPSG